MRSIPEKTPCIFEKNVQSRGIFWIQCLVDSNYVQLVYCIFYNLCYEISLSIDVSDVLKSPTIIIFLSSSPFLSVSSVSISLIFHCSVAKSCSSFLQPHGLQHAGLPCPSLLIAPSVLKLMPTELVMPSNPLILCCPLLLLTSILPSIRVFSSELALFIRWPKCWSFSFSNSSFINYS